MTSVRHPAQSLRLLGSIKGILAMKVKVARRDLEEVPESGLGLENVRGKRVGLERMEGSRPGVERAGLLD